MEQKQLTDYLKLIQNLLSCPRGEEWIQLKHYESLVDAQLIEVMEQVAAQLDQKGNSETATFLNNWAAKLHHIFFKTVPLPSSQEDISEAYLTLIQKLLSCPEGLEENLIAEHKSLIGPGLVHEMREVARQLRDQDEIAMALSLEKMANHLHQVWIREYNFQPDLRKVPTDEVIAPKEESEAPETPLITKAAPSKTFQHNTSQLLDDDIDDLWNSAATYSPAATVTAVEAEGAVPTQTTTQTTSLEPDVYQAIAASLKAIAETLQRASNPLRHLEALEQAYNAEWQLTTDEIEQLIGTKPRCHGKEIVYQRGNWRFTQVGHIGNQTAWQVSKAKLSVNSEA